MRSPHGYHGWQRERHRAPHGSAWHGSAPSRAGDANSPAETRWAVVSSPLKNMISSVGMIILYYFQIFPMWKNKIMFQTTNQLGKTGGFCLGTMMGYRDTTSERRKLGISDWDPEDFTRWSVDLPWSFTEKTRDLRGYNGDRSLGDFKVRKVPDLTKQRGELSRKTGEKRGLSKEIWGFYYEQWWDRLGYTGIYHRFSMIWAFTVETVFNMATLMGIMMMKHQDMERPIFNPKMGHFWAFPGSYGKSHIQTKRLSYSFQSTRPSTSTAPCPLWPWRGL